MFSTNPKDIEDGGLKTRESMSTIWKVLGGGALVLLLVFILIPLILAMFKISIMEMDTDYLPVLLTVIGGILVGYMMLTTAVIANITARDLGEIAKEEAKATGILARDIAKEVGDLAIAEVTETGKQARETAKAIALDKQQSFNGHHNWDRLIEIANQLGDSSVAFYGLELVYCKTIIDLRVKYENLTPFNLATKEGRDAEEDYIRNELKANIRQVSIDRTDKFSDKTVFLAVSTANNLLNDIKNLQIFLLQFPSSSNAI